MQEQVISVFGNQCDVWQVGNICVQAPVQVVDGSYGKLQRGESLDHIAHHRENTEHFLAATAGKQCYQRTRAIECVLFHKGNIRLMGFYGIKHRIPYIVHIPIKLLVEVLLKREDYKHPIHRSFELPGAALIPCPHFWTDVIEYFYLVSLSKARHLAVETGIV